jgi:hypothetical protein
MEDLVEEGEVDPLFLPGPPCAAALQRDEQSPAQVNIITTRAVAPFATTNSISPDRCWSSKSLWTAFALGWLFPPCWWAAAAAGLNSGGDRQCLVVKCSGLSRAQTTAWRASVLMSLLSCVVLVSVLSIFYGRLSVQQAGKLPGWCHYSSCQCQQSLLG